MVNENETVWIQQAQNGDREAIANLIHAFQRPVYNMAYRMLNNQQEAEEATQEAFIRMVTRLESYNNEYKFSTWLLSITRNYCIDLIRKKKMLHLSIDEPLPPHPALISERSKNPEQSAMYADKQVMVQEMLQKLPEDDREAIVLRYFYDHSYDEIASIMETTVSSVKARLFRARQKLAKIGVTMGAQEAVSRPTL